MNKTIQKDEIERYYLPVIRGCELLNSGEFNSLYCLGKAGIGKSTAIDKALKRVNANYSIFSGDISEAKFFEFLQNNNGKIIVLRDISRLLRRIGFIEMLKAATDTREKRIISRHTYAKHEGLEEDFEFTGKIIMELNEIGERYKEDLEALFSRGLFIDLILSIADITKIMKMICKTKEQVLVTDYLIKKVNILGTTSFNLRTQNMAFKVYNASARDKLDWKKQIDLFLNTQMPMIKKHLYRLAGNNPVKRMYLVKFIMKELKISYSSAQRKITDSICLEEIYTNRLKKQALLSINPFN